ncbi:MAG: hypothetical protein PF692_13315, partial [Kiritimatiellae bacterium]|nr:hypothetical protein [Kiritimatiellia bacterium]
PLNLSKKYAIGLLLLDFFLSPTSSSNKIFTAFHLFNALASTYANFPPLATPAFPEPERLGYRVKLQVNRKSAKTPVALRPLVVDRSNKGIFPLSSLFPFLI